MKELIWSVDVNTKFLQNKHRARPWILDGYPLKIMLKNYQYFHLNFTENMFRLN